MTYVDRTLNCVDCGVEFIHSAADQEYYQEKGFVSDPKRCTSCRASRRASRDGGYDVRDIGGPRGYERGDDRPNREYFAVICSSCGNQAQVPVQATHGSPGLLLRLLPDRQAGLIRAGRALVDGRRPSTHSRQNLLEAGRTELEARRRRSRPNSSTPRQQVVP